MELGEGARQIDGGKTWQAKAQIRHHGLGVEIHAECWEEAQGSQCGLSRVRKREKGMKYSERLYRAL